MNRSIKILATAAAMLVFLASCSQKADFQSKPFVRFNQSAINTTEDAGTEKIPVYAYGKDGATVAIPRGEQANTSVTFEVIDGTAVKGTDFTVSPANGVLTFNNSSEAFIEVNVINHPGVYTGSLNFSIKITGASDGFTISSEAVSSLNFTIKDNDHPLANFLGTYKTPVVTDQWGDRYIITSNIEAVDGSTTQLSISNICPYSAQSGYAHKFVGELSADHKVFTVESEQWIVTGALYFFACGIEGGSLVDFPALVFDVDEEAHTFTARTGWAAYVSGSGFYDLIPSGGVVFTKQ